jgi:hypothetical protein
VHEGVLQHAAVPRGEHEAVAVEPLVVLGVVRHRLAVQDVAHGRAAHGEARVAAVRLVDGVDGEEADGVDAVHHRLLRDLRGRSRGGRSRAHRLHRARGRAHLARGRLALHLRAGEGGGEGCHGGGGAGSHLDRLCVYKGGKVGGAEGVTETPGIAFTG